MEIKLCKSEQMGSLGEQNENIIRVPDAIRKKYNLLIGSHLIFNTKDRKKIALEIKKAYKNDVQEENPVCFVTEDLFNKIEILELENVGMKVAIPEITLGCDPEFFILDKDNNIISAGFFFSKQAQVGYDGVMCEIRPSPSDNPVILTETIRSLLYRAKEILGPHYKLYASSCLHGMSAGFHVHLGLPQRYLTHRYRDIIFRYIVRVLDFYVATICALFETTEEAGRRASIGIKYGKVGDYRTKKYTLEYRVPGGTMLKTPLLTCGLLALCKVVAGDAIGRLSIQTNNLTDIDKIVNLNTSTKEIYPNIFDGEQLKSNTNTRDTAVLERFLPTIVSDIRKMCDFGNNRQYIEPLIGMVGHSDKFSGNIIENWLE